MISVIVLTFGTKNYIEDTLKSFLNQSSSSYEILLMAHKKDAETLAVMQPYVEKYDFIRWIVQDDDLGPGHDRNVGIHESQYDYLHFVDGDDLVSPNFIKDYTETIRNRPDVDLFTGNVLYFRDLEWKAQSSKEFSERMMAMERTKSSFIRQSDITHFPYHSKVYKKSFLISRELFFPDTNIMYDDFLHSHMIIAQKEPVIRGFVEKSKYYTLYRDREGSTVNLPLKGSAHVAYMTEYLLDYGKRTERIHITKFFYGHCMGLFRYLYCRTAKDKFSKKDIQILQKNKEDWLNRFVSPSMLSELKKSPHLATYILASKVNDYKFLYALESRFSQSIKIGLKTQAFWHFHFYVFILTHFMKKTAAFLSRRAEKWVRKWVR